MSAPVTPSQPHAPPSVGNALARETSPYLLQHAHNPVDWRPWGPEAFALARARDKPIFLSVGYSTCYWCHVMERESFESGTIAALMNEHFINIKVDREERPDVDDIYMAAVQLMTGQGGWPMSVFLEPKTLKPFYAGTYFPAEPMYGRQSFPQLLTAIAAAWKDQREAVIDQAEQVAAAVRQRLTADAGPLALDSRPVAHAISLLKQIHDETHGGFGRAPKFPQPVFLELLIGAAWDDEAARRAILHTLNRMAAGGMYDQVGGGFHRYSTDEKWLVPHFEKMLYDNGQLASIYAETFARTGDDYYAEIVRETLDYVLREMTDTRGGGGFFSAQDAEVDGREGLNYLWLPAEIEQALTAAGLRDDVSFAQEVYGLREGPNFRDPHHPEDSAKNVLFLSDRPDVLASRMGDAPQSLDERLARVNAALLKARDQRKRPRLDDKVLVGWNGMMIAGMADGGRVLGEGRYIEAASQAMDFILSAMRGPDGGLLRSYRDQRAKIDAFLEDYALLIRGLLALHRATGDARRLAQAGELEQIARSRFWDEAAGGYFDTLADQHDLFVRSKSSYDGAVPSGNGVMLLNLLDLHELTRREPYLDDASRTLAALSGAIAENPLATALSTLALHRMPAIAPERVQVIGPGGEAPVAAPGPVVDPITIEASIGELRLAQDRPTRVDVTLRIAAPYHINAHHPGDVSLIPLELRLENAAGLRLHAEYPEGEMFHGEIRIHRDTVTIPVRIERAGPVSGQTRLLAIYQPCSDTACLRPVTKAVPVEITLEQD